MNHTEALEKVKKLLRLAQSANQHEAALAASRAQEIIDRYKIEKFALEYEENAKAPDEPIKDFGIDPIDNASATWKYRLAHVIARENQCKVYTSGRALNLIGRPSDVATVRYLYAWLSREVDRLAGMHCTGCGRTYYNNFRNGCVDTISERLHQQRKQTVEAVKSEAAGSHALMVIESALANQQKQMAEVQQWAKTHMDLRTGKSSAGRSDFSARLAGRQAGQSINLNPAAGKLHSTRKSLHERVCPNCGQFQRPRAGMGSVYDCLNDCVVRGFAPKVVVG